MGAIRVGTAGWSDSSLIATGWYPPGVYTPEQRLRCYAERFDFVEVNSTYYGLPRTSVTKAWAERTPDGFVFNVKAFSLLTRHRTPVAMLPPELRPAGPREVRPGDLEPELFDQVWQRFLDELDPLVAAGKLGLLLFQFPPYFRPGERARAYLAECARRVAPLRMCAEFRNPAWLSEEERDGTLDFLARHGIAYVCVDMTQGLPGSVPPVTAVTAPEAVLRLHGRSPEWEWGDKLARYRYRYDDTELADWAERVRDLAARAETTFVVFNNCSGDSAHVNAARFRDLVPAEAR
ncbi:DUF72 domain-containing protein [Crossiella sp. CA-258035]|uniref:DUF72 domain-containing protein n=1 Tax=Crossiella sp. CA-258035 TaxID=2981138 RepID=UPI0024BCFF91|nr:DUF72 domain-containing protein [Crossiella sp. CA-258035]WHT20169.1 DUF72 domain-containing protein [Crossiella sp. CA-258035]